MRKITRYPEQIRHLERSTRHPERSEESCVRSFAALRMTVFIMFCLIVCVPSEASEWSDIYFNANQKYAEGRYEEARVIYESLLSQNVKSQNLYYNLGNTYYKLGQIGRSILNYERAKKLGVFDEDTMANANFVSSILKVKQPNEDASWVHRAGRAVRDALPPLGWFIASWVLYLGCIISIAIIIFHRVSSRGVVFVAVLLAIFMTLSLLIFRASNEFHQNYREGVIVDEKTQVRYSPSYDGSVAFELSEGLKAEILVQQKDWTQIRLGPKKSGWIKSLSLEQI